MQNQLNCLEIELAKNRVKVVQAEMGDVDLTVIIFLETFLFIILLLNFKETVFNLLLHLGVECLLIVDKFKLSLFKDF